MTSRRSRLKAVANLPVRRKVPELQENSNEVTSSPILISGKVPSSSPKTDEIFNHSISQNSEKAKEIQNSENKNIESVRDNKYATEFYNHENQVKEPDTSDLNNISTFENNSDIHKDSTVNVENNNVSNSSSVTYNKQLQPGKSIVFPVLREKPNLQRHETNLEINEAQNYNSCFIINPFSNSDNTNSDIGACEYINNDNSNTTITEGLKCYTILKPRKKSVSVATSLGHHNMVKLDWNSLTQRGKEVIYFTGLIKPTKLQVNLLKFVGNSFSADNENFDSAGTTDQTRKIVEGTNINVNENESNISQSIGARSTARNSSASTCHRTNVIESGDYYKSSVTSIKDKLVENSNHLVYHTISSDSDFLNTNLKQNTSTSRKKKQKCHDFTKKLSNARREFQKKYDKTKPDRSTLRMIDLIFYNPSTNPMESKLKLEKKQISEEFIVDSSEEEAVDEPEAMDCGNSQVTESSEVDNMGKMPVPQVKIGVNGEIILDEKSLVIETTDAKKGREEILNSVPIFEDRETKVSYYRGKSKKTRDWTDIETKRFYKALNTIGPDFSLMRKYFPERSRLDLKNKFKREERLNRNLIDKALNNPSEFDMTQLEQDLADEKKAAEKEAEMKLSQSVKVKQKSKRKRCKSSVLFREVTASERGCEDSQFKSVVVNSKRLSQLEKEKKKKEVNFIFQKVLLKSSEKEMSELPGISSTSSCVFKSTNQVMT